MRNWNCRWPRCNSRFHRFQTTYEELKLEFRQSLCQFFTLPDYLWGIETLFSTDGQAINISASRLPMRNWNCRVWPVLRNAQGASRLPMRNWNLAPEERAGLETSASRLPMRNWNFLPLLPFSQLRDGFQTTYEELKHRNIVSPPLQHASRLPMRNWNIKLFSNPARSSGGFQTTYEELKPSSRDCEFPGDGGASRLPMRNWNLRIFWNNIHARLRFQTTYEELKRGREYAIFKGIDSFQTTYEELKLPLAEM